MKIRSITYFLSPDWPFSKEKIQHAGQFLESAHSALSKGGYEVQTTRLATPSFATLVDRINPEEVIRFALALEETAGRHGCDYISIGPALPDIPDSFLLIPGLIGATRNVFASGLMTPCNNSVSLNATKLCAQIIHTIAKLEKDGFANLRFAALANVPAGAPFFPAAYSESDAQRPHFALAMQAADYAVSAVECAGSLLDVRLRLVALIEESSRRILDICKALESNFKVTFSGFDFTLAPFPEPELSLGTALENLGVPAVGKHGSLAAVAFLTDALDRADYPRAGFNGLMFPVLEDAVLAARVADGSLNLKDLLLYSTVCGTGLDTVPLPGETSVESLYAILLDIALLSIRLDKPLTARLMPIPSASANQMTNFDFPYFGNSRVMDVSTGQIQGLLAGEEQIELVTRNKNY